MMHACIEVRGSKQARDEHGRASRGLETTRSMGNSKKNPRGWQDDKLDTLTCRVAGSVELMATNGYLLCS